MKERNVQDCFIAQYFSVEKGNGGRPETWERLKEVLMDNLQKRQAGHEGRLPGGFAFSLREEDACRAVTPSVLEGLLGRFLTDARRSGTVYTPRFSCSLDGPGSGIFLAGIQIAFSQER